MIVLTIFVICTKEKNYEKETTTNTIDSDNASDVTLWVCK